MTLWVKIFVVEGFLSNTNINVNPLENLLLLLWHSLGCLNR